MIRRRGFTLVELVVVIAVIAILATLATLGLSRYLQEGRDNRRASNATVIAEALEKYYDQNGEYPSCSAITGSGSSVVTNVLKGLDQASLLAPGASSTTTNSIQCGTTLTVSGPDFYQYAGDGSTDCNGSGSCLSFTLYYKDEVDGQIKQISSRRTGLIATSGTPVLTVSTASSTSISASWTAVSNATSYRIQTANLSDTNFLSPVADTSLTTTNTVVSSLAQGTTYNFRVIAQINTDVTNWSTVKTATTSVDPPSATPTMTAAMSGSTAQGTASVASCPAGTTAQYIFQWYKTSTATPGSWSAWTNPSTTRTYGQTNASQANQYGFHAQSLCAGPNASSSNSATSNTATVVVPYSTPAAPGYAGPGSWLSGNYAIVNYTTSCPAGTSVTNGYFYSWSWDGTQFGPHPFGYNDWWQLGPSGGANVTYQGHYQCTNYYGTSPGSATSTATVNVHN